MVNPNAGGNNTGAAKAGNNPWGELSNIKMGAFAAAGEAIGNKKFSLASKFENWRANKAKQKSEERLESATADKKEAQSDVKFYNSQMRSTSKWVNQSGKSVSNAEHTLESSQKRYEKAKDKANTGEYIGKQVKQVADILSKGGSVVKNGLRAWWQGRKQVKIRAADLVSAKPGEDVYAKAAEGLKTQTKQVNQDYEDAKAAFASSKNKFERNKKKHEKNVEQKKAAKYSLEIAKKEYKDKQEDFEFAQASYEEANKNYDDARKTLEKASEKKKVAAEKMDAAGARAKEAKQNVKIAETVLKLREQLGSTDVNKVKEAIAAQREELQLGRIEVQATINDIAKAVIKMVGVDEEGRIPEDKRNQYHRLINAAVGDKEKALNAQEKLLKKQEAIIAEYEAAKAQQAEKVTKNEKVKKGLRSIVSGFFARFATAPAGAGEADDGDAE